MIMLIFQQLKQFISDISFIINYVAFVMSVKVQCNKHKKIQFTIPQSIDEAVELNSFPQIKEMANHLENYPSCKMIRSLNIE